MKKVWRFITLSILFLFIINPIVAANQDLLEFTIPNYGCPMAHSDPQMTDNCRLPIPRGEVDIVWHEENLISEKAGSFGLGFSGNGKIAACTYHGVKDNLVIYDFDGNIIWKSGFLLNYFSVTSAPIVDIHNRVIACDNQKIIMVDPFDADNDSKIIEWVTLLPEKGLAFSPVITENNKIILATKNGPIYVFNSSDGKLLDYKYLYPNLFFNKNLKFKIGFYETINTPCVNKNRVYILTQFTRGGIFSLFKRYARLYAIDVKPDADQILQIAWHYNFGGPSGASPLMINDTIFFDGNRLKSTIKKDPHIYSLKDNNNTYKIEWIKKFDVPILGSFAADPREGFWIIDNYNFKVKRYNTSNGNLLEEIDIDELINESGQHQPCSVITICGNDTDPVMVIGTCSKNNLRFSSYIITIDLVNKSLLWKVKFAEGWMYNIDFAFGQFPVLIKNDEPRIVFASVTGGAWAIGVEDNRLVKS